ncbi:MAG: hypothetical protein EZS28_033990, partial [Streblomastix strix]
QSQTKRIALTQKREDDQYKNEPLISTEMMNKFQWCLGKDRISFTEDEYEQTIKEQGQSSIMNVDGRQNEDNIYILHSVFVHSGETNESHYKVYIQPKCDGRWYLFNDQYVKEVDKSDAIKDNFGRLQNQELITNQNMNDQNNLETNKVFSAYMLVYIKRSVLKSVLLDTIESDIPIYIREAIIARREAKTRLTFKIFTDTGLVRKYNSALHASMQALARSKRVGRQLTKMELVKVAAQAVLNAKTKQAGYDAANQQQQEHEEDPDIYTWIDNTDTSNTDQSADEAETQEIILSQLLKQQIFDDSNSVETLSISRQTTLQKRRRGPGIRIPTWDYSSKQLSLYSGSQILIQLRPSKREILKDPTVNVVEWQIQKESQIHILIVDWKDEKASRALNMKVTLDRDDDYDTVSTAVAKEV